MDLDFDLEMETKVRMKNNPRSNHKAITCRRPEFFIVFIPDFYSHQLQIPSGFQKHMRGTSVPRKWTIKNSANKRWVVYLERQEDAFLFTDGWEEFVDEQSLELGDFLVFGYDGDSTFSVKIYGRNGCAKNLVNVAAANRGRNEEGELSKGKGNIKGNVEDALDDSSSSGDSEARTFESLENENKAILHEVKRGRVGRPPTRQEGNRALDAANRYISNSKHPCFRVVLTLNYMKSNSMYIPPKFAMTYINGRTEHVCLKVSNRLWHVNVGKTHRYYELKDGWSEFKIDNHLREGDACVIELVDLVDFILDVTIFRCDKASGDDDP
ncbi:hypothetical protein Dimus_017087 [Dionaea muscipula]